MPVSWIHSLARVGFVLICGLAWCRYAGAVEHPGLGGKDCSSCHAAKLRGTSVHSAMQLPCTVCHVTEIEGDMMLVKLSMPRQRICSACHEEASVLQRHTTAVKGTCVDCHDSHSSEQKMLLLRRVAEAARPVKDK